VSPPASVRVATTVAVAPDDAFEVFTAEIDAWYQRGPHNFADPARALGLRFDPFVGGHLVEVYDGETGEGRVMGRVLAWDPGVRLLFTDTHQTEIEVWFEPDGDGKTRVTLEHRGFERLPDDEAFVVARYGGQLLVKWYGAYLRALATTRKGTP
jgi:hypothetical protein